MIVLGGSWWESCLSAVVEMMTLINLCERMERQKSQHELLDQALDEPKGRPLSREKILV